MDHLDRVFMEYMSTGTEIFEHNVMAKVNEKFQLGGMDLDHELLNLSQEVLQRARSIESTVNVSCNEWRDLSALLRRLAHRVHRQYGNKEDVAFLRAV